MENEHYLTVEDKKHLASKAVGGTALGLGIAGTALGLLNGGLSHFGFGGRNSNWDNGWDNQCSQVNSCGNWMHPSSEGIYLERKENADYIEITKEYYEGKLSNLRELTESFYSLDQKIQAAKDVAALQNRESFDALNKRIIELEKDSAIEKATRPLIAEINNLKLNYVNTGAQHGIADTRIMTTNMIKDLETRTRFADELEAERRACADGKIVNYVNSTFYPLQIADVTTGDTTHQQPTYNPLCSSGTGNGCKCII